MLQTFTLKVFGSIVVISKWAFQLQSNYWNVCWQSYAWACVFNVCMYCSTRSRTPPTCTLPTCHPTWESASWSSCCRPMAPLCPLVLCVTTVAWARVSASPAWTRGRLARRSFRPSTGWLYLVSLEMLVYCTSFTVMLKLFIVRRTGRSVVVNTQS